jgi:hypothetical protein
MAKPVRVYSYCDYIQIGTAGKPRRGRDRSPLLERIIATTLPCANLDDGQIATNRMPTLLSRYNDNAIFAVAFLR